MYVPTRTTQLRVMMGMARSVVMMVVVGMPMVVGVCMAVLMMVAVSV